MIQFSQCSLCVWYHGDTCEAFSPQTIPKDINSNKFDHTKRYPGDHGITFLPDGSGAERAQKAIFSQTQDQSTLSTVS